MANTTPLDIVDYDIIIYAGSLRPGGGLTVLKLVIESCAEISNCRITVYTGAEDLSVGLKEVFQRHPNVKEKRFFASTHSSIRYLISKLYFLAISIFKSKHAILFSFNYYLPTVMREIVYHINLSLFLRTGTETLSEKIKQWDAGLACRLATVNIFESEYLREIAGKRMQQRINLPYRLYIGANPRFFVKNDIAYASNQLLMVSSTAPHKDNETCIKVLRRLHDIRPEARWRLCVVGGQAQAQWNPILSFARKQNVGDFVQITGSLPTRKLSELMTSSLCLISTSRIESFCMVAVEAMAAGCPAIVTDRTSMPESVGPAGIVVEAGNVEQFVEAMLSLADNPELREAYICKGREWAQGFTQALFKKNMLEILQKSDIFMNQ